MLDSNKEEIRFNSCNLTTDPKEISLKQIYYYLLNISENYEILPSVLQILRDQFKPAIGEPSPVFIKQFDFDEHTIQTQLRETKDVYTQIVENIFHGLDFLNQEKKIFFLKQYAPLAIIDGCWLQNTYNAISCQNETNLKLLKLHSYEIGEGDILKNHGNYYLSMMQSLGEYFLEPSSWEFINNDDVLNPSYEMPVLLLSLSLFPQTFMPELLGVNLFCYLCGLFPVNSLLYDFVQNKKAQVKFFDTHSAVANEDKLMLAIEAIINFLHDDEKHTSIAMTWRRVWNGFIKILLCQYRWLEQIVSFLSSSESLNPRMKMLKLIKDKAPYGFGYHPKSRLAGKIIDEWLDPDNLNPEACLNALAGSHYIKPGDAANSSFFKFLVSPKGPMFKIFSDAELNIIAEWMNSLTESTMTVKSAEGDKNTSLIETNLIRIPTISEQLKHENTTQSRSKYSPLSIRELFYYLLHIEFFPDLLPFAKEYAQNWINLSAEDESNQLGKIPFENYNHEAIEHWLNNLHKTSIASYVPFQDKPLTKEQVIHDTLQGCSIAFIDGAWLQKSGAPGNCRGKIGVLLHRTYVDELGNGEMKDNHPYIYDELIKQMGVSLPKFGTREYCFWDGFTDDSFKVPVFWLAISHFSKHFYPEILGLNLAMELSGVGGTYMMLADEVKKYGFSPYFFNLHNTIDNLSSGHTAWALRAIRFYMDEMLLNGGNYLMQLQWPRVWNGFKSFLAPAGV